MLRYEQPSYHFCRWTTKDTEFHGRTVPAERVLVLLPPAANRDETKWDDPDRFDIHRKPAQIYTFSFGAHFCLGANLARIEGRIALETILQQHSGMDVQLRRSNPHERHRHPRLAPAARLRSLKPSRTSTDELRALVRARLI